MSILLFWMHYAGPDGVQMRVSEHDMNLVTWSFLIPCEGDFLCRTIKPRESVIGVEAEDTRKHT